MGSGLHPLHSQILEVVSNKRYSVKASVVILKDRVQSQTVQLRVCYWLLTGADNVRDLISAPEVPEAQNKSPLQNKLFFGRKTMWGLKMAEGSDG